MVKLLKQSQAVAAVTAVMGVAAVLSMPARAATSEADLQAHASWRATIEHTKAPAKEGCYHAAFPSTEWQEVACSANLAKPRPYRGNPNSRTVGNGNDYVAETNSAISKAVGTFSPVTGVKTETDGGSNYYSLQLNTGLMTSATCKGGSSNCKGWQQFVYVSIDGEAAIFMQYWLIGYDASGDKCPSGWEYGASGSTGSQCVKNSKQVEAPIVPVTELGDIKLTGTTVSGGNDSAVLTTSSDAYTVTGKDSVVYAAKAWELAEWNVIGDGDASQAKFNTGSSITVDLALTDGSTTAPRCVNAGETGETNNLSLSGSCKTTSGSTPSISFVESN